MAKRSVHEAAVEAVRLVVHADFGGKIGYCYHEADCPEPGQYYRRCEPSAQRIVSALVASAEVREARVPCLRWGGSGLPCDYRAGTPTNHPELGTAIHPACFLAALAGTEVAESSD